MKVKKVRNTLSIVFNLCMIQPSGTTTYSKTYFRFIEECVFKQDDFIYRKCLQPNICTTLVYLVYRFLHKGVHELDIYIIYDLYKKKIIPTNYITQHKEVEYLSYLINIKRVGEYFESITPNKIPSGPKCQLT